MAELPSHDDIARTLGVGRHARPHRRWLKWSAVALAMIVGLGLIAHFTGREEQGPVYKTTQVKRGNLVVTVSATGTLQPVNQVDVGSELSGTIAAVDVDYNDHVVQGQVLARLDTEMLQARMVESRAALQSAKANQLNAAATVTETKLTYQRCKKLVTSQMCAPSDLDKDWADYQRALAGQEMAKAATAQAQATLEQQQTNLQKAVIRAPISGVILNRVAEKGQTVAASFQTPVLFTLAEDLKKMELIASVDEADIGQVELGQHASFTVDAYPNRTFDANVTQIRHAPVTVQGVVTYQTVLAVNNSDLALLPGMTATADIKVKEVDNTLLVPNAALRFVPPSTAPKSSSHRFLGIFPAPHRPQATTAPVARNGRRQVWILRNGVPVAVAVTVGSTDGVVTQVIAGDIRPGEPVIVDAVVPSQ